MNNAQGPQVPPSMRESQPVQSARQLVWWQAMALSAVLLASALLPKPALGKDSSVRDFGNVRVMATAVVTQLGTEYLVVAVEVPPRGAIPVARISIKFRGRCAEVLPIEGEVMDGSPFAPNTTSPKGRDLPIAGLLHGMRETLLEICPDLQVLRLKLKSNTYDYVGTLVRADGWTLQDGNVPTSFDGRALVDLQLTDTHGRLRILHRGKCEAEPTLLLEPVKPELTSRGISLLTDYIGLANWAAQQYGTQCRDTERMRFALALMPSGYFCIKPGDCFLETRRAEGRWETSSSQMEPLVSENPIKNVPDMVEVLAAGAFDVMQPYQGFFSLFVALYFDTYSNVCRQHIRQPVGRVTRYTTEKRDGQGNLITEEVRDGAPIQVEAAHAWAYDAHEAGVRNYMMTRAARSAGTAIGARGGFDAGMRVVNDVRAFQSEMKVFLEGNCMEERVQTVQQNLLNYAGSKPPVVGKYLSSKRPVTERADVTMSAPEFTAAYLRAREEQASAANRQRAEAVSRHGSPTFAPLPDKPSANASTTVRPSGASDPNPGVVRQYAAELQQLEIEYQKQIQGATFLQRIRIEGEYRLKKLQLERAMRDRTGK